jgi:hypothetical protein
MKYETGALKQKGLNTMATRPMRMQREMSIEKSFGLVDPPRAVGRAVSVDTEPGISGGIVSIPYEFLNFRELHVSEVHELRT